MTVLKIAVTDKEIESCFDVLLELRPHLERKTFLSTVKNMQNQGFNLAYIEEDSVVVAVAGYRISQNLFMGKNLYVDDLVTSEVSRSKGYGASLINFLRDMAVENDCSTLHLDSGTQRHQAHKFYFRNGFTIASYHFSEPVAKSV